MGTEENSSTDNQKMPSESDAGRCHQVDCDWLFDELTKNQPSSSSGSTNSAFLANNGLLVLDCRGACDYEEGHIRGSVALAVPSIMLRRLAAGKVELLSTIKCQELRSRVQQLLGTAGKFVLVDSRGAEEDGDREQLTLLEEQENMAPRENRNLTIESHQERLENLRNSPSKRQTETIHVLARRLRNAGGQVAMLKGKWNFCFDIE